jgi:hypothetical protein
MSTATPSTHRIGAAGVRCGHAWSEETRGYYPFQCYVSSAVAGLMQQDSASWESDFTALLACQKLSGLKKIAGGNEMSEHDLDVWSGSGPDPGAGLPFRAARAKRAAAYELAQAARDAEKRAELAALRAKSKRTWKEKRECARNFIRLGQQFVSWARATGIPAQRIVRSEPVFGWVVEVKEGSSGPPDKICWGSATTFIGLDGNFYSMGDRLSRIRGSAIDSSLLAKYKQLLVEGWGAELD